jgi:hypothetical protein
MKLVSDMAQAWAAYRVATLTGANTLVDLNKLSALGEEDLLRLREFSLIDADEYTYAINELYTAEHTRRVELIMEVASV